MTNWTLYKKKDPKRFNTSSSIRAIVDTYPELKERWNKYIHDNYPDRSEEKLHHIDIGEVSRFIIDRILSQNIEDLHRIFDQIEEILNNCDEDTENLMIIGLLEGIQNIGGGENINYWTGFDRWLGEKTKDHWNKLIIFWEGEDAIEKFKMKYPGKEDSLKIDREEFNTDQ